MKLEVVFFKYSIEDLDNEKYNIKISKAHLR